MGNTMQIDKLGYIANNYAEVAERVIAAHEDLHWLKKAPLSIGYVKSYQEKKKGGKLTLGECIKVKELYKAYIPHDFLIVIYEKNIVGFSDAQLEILLYHELLHVGMDDKTGEPKFRINPHDLEDFRAVVEQYGVDWAK